MKMKKNKMKRSNNVTNKCNKEVTNKKQNQVTDCKNVSSKKENIGFESEDHSFEFDENADHSFELRDCK